MSKSGQTEHMLHELLAKKESLAAGAYLMSMTLKATGLGPRLLRPWQ